MSIENPAAILYDADGHPLGSASYPLRTDPTGSTTQPISAASLPLPAGAATESGNLASILIKLADPASQTTLAAVLAKLSSDPATQTTLAALLAKLDVALSTRAVESGGNLAAIAGKDFATQTTLAAIKTKTDGIPSDPAREGGKLTTIDSTLASIQSTAGVKKITDPLPAGTNTIGKVDQGAGGASAWLVTGGGGGGSTQVEGRAADGAAPVGNPVLVGGQDGTNVQSILTDTQGRLIIAPPGTKSALKGFSNGKVTRAATAQAPVEWTAYTEQTSNAQRSIASASANDTAAGTGARTVKITYYSVSAGVITGPFYETITLNGTSYVNTVSTTIAFIEKIEVLTVGSGLTNAGILTLKAGTGGTGATISTIGVGDGQTYIAHHYVASGRVMYLTGLSVGVKGADSATFDARVDNPSNANAYERTATDNIRVGTSQNTITRPYGTPVEITGPAHVRIYVTPDSTSSRVYFASMDFYEE